MATFSLPSLPSVLGVRGVSDIPEPAVQDLDQISGRRIRLAVGVVFYVGSLIIFRDVLLAIPDVLSGRSILVGDELVPFVNPSSQLFEQAAGEFNELTNGYEFRVRYSFLTTWLRHYQVLPFAILFVIPTVFYSVYLTVTWFMRQVFTSLTQVSIALAAAFPTALTYLIMTYAKITHFYTLIVGLAMMTIAVLTMLYAVIFARDRWVRPAIVSCMVTLFNPAVHYLVLFAVLFALMAVTLALGEFALWIRTGGPTRLPQVPARLGRILRSPRRFRLARRLIVPTTRTTLGRLMISGALFLVLTLIPYALFVKFVALRGVENLSETVPGDFYFIRDASVSWLHLLSWDLAGIMDKVLFGDYLAKVPRFPNIAYSILFSLPLVVPALRRSLLTTRAHRQLFGVLYVSIAFAMWATIGYAEPIWFPSFHRSLAGVARAAQSTDTVIGDLVLTGASTVVQVLRFPHRFQLILFALAPVIMTLPLAWGIDRLNLRWTREGDTARSHRASLALRFAATAWLATIFFVPFWSNAPYRQVFGSGDFGSFLAPYPVGDLREVKDELAKLPEGKTVVLPPTETSKLTTDANGVNHKFIDKFYIYWLDEPSFYYGLTGDASNKFEFFLILRSIYYQQDWWVNQARDIGVRYIVVNRNLRDNGGIGAEYLPNVESYTEPALQRAGRYVELRFENDAFALYELIDQPSDDRETLLINSSWTEYLQLVFNRLDLSQCYDLEYLPYYEPADAEPGEALSVYTRNPASTAVDLWALRNQPAFFPPSPQTFAFDSNIVASSYYLSPMFRMFLLFSNTKWNRTNMIEPGLFGTLRGSFIGVPSPTGFSIPVVVPEDGSYRVLLRSAPTANQITAQSTTLGMDTDLELRPPQGSVEVFDIDHVYDLDRQPIDISLASVGELETRFGEEIVPLTVRYSYHDLGTVQATAGSHAIDITKHDANPVLIEGIVLIPEATFKPLTIPADVTVVDDPRALGCNTEYEVFGMDSPGYVDPAANVEHINLTQDELLTLAAAGVTALAPDDSGGIGNTWVGLMFIAALLAASTRTIRFHTRPRSHDEDDAPGHVPPTKDKL